MPASKHTHAPTSPTPTTPITHKDRASPTTAYSYEDDDVEYETDTTEYEADPDADFGMGLIEDDGDSVGSHALVLVMPESRRVEEWGSPPPPGPISTSRLGGDDDMPFLVPAKPGATPDINQPSVVVVAGGRTSNTADKLINENLIGNGSGRMNENVSVHMSENVSGRLSGNVSDKGRIKSRLEWFPTLEEASQGVWSQTNSEPSLSSLVPYAGTESSTTSSTPYGGSQLTSIPNFNLNSKAQHTIELNSQTVLQLPAKIIDCDTDCVDHKQPIRDTSGANIITSTLNLVPLSHSDTKEGKVGKVGRNRIVTWKPVVEEGNDADFEQTTHSLVLYGEEKENSIDSLSAKWKNLKSGMNEQSEKIDRRRVLQLLAMRQKLIDELVSFDILFVVERNEFVL